MIIYSAFAELHPVATGKASGLTQPETVAAVDGGAISFFWR